MPETTADEYRDFLLEGTRTAKLATVRRGGHPHVAPIWFLLDGERVIFTTARDTVKGHAIRRDGRVSLCVDDEPPPFAFAWIEGTTSTSEDMDDLLHWATRIAARYAGGEQAEAFSRRNAVPGEMLVRFGPEKTVTENDVVGW